MSRPPDQFDVSIASIVLLSAAGASIAMGQCRPPAPLPLCSRWHVIRKRETWGSYTTQWRPFPGDSLGLTPTAAEEKAADLQRELPTYIVPTPDKEDRAGAGPKESLARLLQRRPGAVVEGEINDLPPLPQNQRPPAPRLSPSRARGRAGRRESPRGSTILICRDLPPHKASYSPCQKQKMACQRYRAAGHAITMG